MPTPYTSVTEHRAIEEFKKKIEKEESIKSIERPEPPDVLIKTSTNRIVWAEIASILRTKELAAFLNKFGLSKTGGPPHIHEERFENYAAYITPIRNGIIEMAKHKDSKASYNKVVENYGKGNLILYLDDPLFSSHDFEYLMSSPISFGCTLKHFSTVYLYIPDSYTYGAETKKVGGLYQLLG